MKSIRSRLVIGLGLIIVFFLAQAALVWWGSNTTREAVTSTTRKNTVASSQLSELAVLAQQVRRYEKEYFVYVSNEERRNNYIKEWTGTSDKIAKQLGVMRANAEGAFNPDDLGKIGNWVDAADFYSSEMKKIFDVVNARAAEVTTAASAPVATPTAAIKGAAPVEPPKLPTMFSSIEVNSMIGPGKDRLSGVLVKGVSEMSVEKTKQTLALSEVTESGFKQLLGAVMLTVAIGVLIASILLVTLPRAVTAPLAELTASVDELSKGNLDRKFDNAGVAEFEGLAKSLERMRVAQQALLARLRR
jgi:HAMP domain-containing protein